MIKWMEKRPSKAQNGEKKTVRRLHEKKAYEKKELAERSKNLS